MNKTYTELKEMTRRQLDKYFKSCNRDKVLTEHEQMKLINRRTNRQKRGKK